MKTALICGVTGQDGVYLVWVTSREAQVSSFANLDRLGIRLQVQVLSTAQGDFLSVLDTLSRSDPDEIYFLSGQSSVCLSFKQPAESIDSIALGALNLLKTVRLQDRPVRVYHASSSECFGDVSLATGANEMTPFRPRGPYGVAKASAHWLIAKCREAYGIYSCNDILFNHESPLRTARFVTRKIVAAACRITAGSDERLCHGRLNIIRDWGWTPDFVEAVWRMLQQDAADDYVIATGESYTLASFVDTAFAQVKLGWRSHANIDPTLFPPSEIAHSTGNPEKAMKGLGRKVGVAFPDLIANLVRAEQAILAPNC